MKRFVAVLLVIVLAMTMVGSGIAEDRQAKAKAYMDDVYDYLKIFVALYKDNPTNFDAEYCEITYKYFRLYAALMEIWGIEAAWELKVSSGTGVGTRVREILDVSKAESDYELDVMLSELWRRYRKQEYTEQQFMDIMTQLIESTVNE